MIDWIKTEGTGHCFFVLFPACLILLFFLMKDRRKTFLIPSFLITLVIVNPLFYKYWTALGLYAYWRILWIVPVVPAVASVIPAITERTEQIKQTAENSDDSDKPGETAGIDQKWGVFAWKSIVTAAGVIAIVLGGTFLYSTANNPFRLPAENSAKLPADVVAIADRLLELGEETGSYPRVILQDPLGVYLRQYTASVNSLYGRDIGGSYIASPGSLAVKIDKVIGDPDGNMAAVSQSMLDNGYDYLVMTERETGDVLELVDSIAGYQIYKAIGKPTQMIERNDLGQIVSVTLIDEQGRPKNNIDGYAATSYIYDNNGYVVKQFYTDTAGNGKGGVERAFDSASRVIMQRNINADGLPYLQPGGFYGYTQTYDKKGALLSRTYVDIDGKAVQRTDGYSSAVWETQEDGAKTIVFYDLDGNTVNVSGLNLAKDVKVNEDGWSDWIRPQYDAANNSISIGSLNLGDKQEGDFYTCQLEIEFKDVQATEDMPFRFWAQGTADGSWQIGNVWTSNLIYYETPPKDGTCYYSVTNSLSEEMAAASAFDMGFRCDYWKSGAFRVRAVKVEKGDTATVWSPGV